MLASGFSIIISITFVYIYIILYILGFVNKFLTYF